MSNRAQVCNLSQLLRQTAALHPERAGLGAVFNMGGAAVANYLSVLEAA